MSDEAPEDLGALAEQTVNALKEKLLKPMTAEVKEHQEKTAKDVKDHVDVTVKREAVAGLAAMANALKQANWRE